MTPSGTEPSRPSAHDIYDRVRQDAEDELGRPATSLGFSGLFAGFTIGATPLAVAIALTSLGDGDASRFVAYLLYPIGFIAVNRRARPVLHREHALPP